MTHHTIPATPEQVTDEWLSSVLRESGSVAQASVIAHTTELVELQGAAAVVARLELEYDAVAEAAPRSVVAKFTSPHEPIRALMHGFGGYMREVEFYRQFGSDPGISTPRCYHADIDPNSGVFVLLLEDMRDCRISDLTAPSIEDVEVAVRHLAPFHAKWWNAPRLRELEFLRYPGSPANKIFMAQARGAFAMALPAAKEQFGSGFPTELVTVAEHLLASFDVVLEERQQDRGTTTLVHGDYHPQQIFYESERGGRFAVFDWQTVGAGNGGDDLARIIVTGLNIDQREAADGRLIALYHSLLVEHGVTGYDIEHCREDFRLGLLTSLVINTIAGPNIDRALIEEAEAAGVFPAEVLFVRLAAAVEAHDVHAILPA